MTVTANAVGRAIDFKVTPGASLTVGLVIRASTFHAATFLHKQCAAGPQQKPWWYGYLSPPPEHLFFPHLFALVPWLIYKRTPTQASERQSAKSFGTARPSVLVAASK